MGSINQYRRRRNIAVVVLTAILVFFGVNPGFLADIEPFEDSQVEQTDVLAEVISESELARGVLDSLQVKGRAAKTGYSRSEFGTGWAQIGDCDIRNIMLRRGLNDVDLADDNCVVLGGTLQDPYTGRTLPFLRGSTTSSDVQIDHVVALSDAWQKGAQRLEFQSRVSLANDPLNLLAVEGDANQQKGDSDAASWLPSNKSYRCLYVARQVAVKAKYSLWVTIAEKAAIRRVLNGCGEQAIPAQT